MAVQRCPECGGRIHTNYCDVCMRKVPFSGVRTARRRDPWELSSAHREEAGHKCITFDTPATPSRKQTLANPKPAFPERKPAQKKEPKMTTVVAIVLAILSLIPTIFSLLEDVHIDNPEPEYNVEALVSEEDLPVIQPTGLYSDGEIEIFADALGLYYGEPALSIMIDNFSDRDLDVIVETVAVNGYILDAGMSVYVEAWESCQAFLMLNQEELEEYDIRQIEQIDLNLWIFDADTYDEIAVLDAITIETDTQGA